MSAANTHPWHETAWQRLHRARVAARLPHALLLAGLPGMGKRDFADRLAAALVCPHADAQPDGDACGHCPACSQYSAGSHPDLLRVSPEDPTGQIKISAIRSLVGRSTLAAEQGGYRVFVVDPAEQMNRASANALLKTLEEPASRAVLILVTSHVDRLPATVRSRCQLQTFPVPPLGLVSDWLVERIGEDADPADLLAISGGAPLGALRAHSEGWLAEDQRLLAMLADLRARRLNPVAVVEEWEKWSITRLFDAFKRCLVDLIRLCGDAQVGARFHPSLHGDLLALGQGIPLRHWYGLQDMLWQLERDSAHNLNRAMCLEYVVNHWLQMTRPGGN